MNALLAKKYDFELQTRASVVSWQVAPMRYDASIADGQGNTVTLGSHYTTRWLAERAVLVKYLQTHADSIVDNCAMEEV